MENQEGITRRSFVGSTAKAAAVAGIGAWALASPKVLGANEKIRVGFIGPGGRGFHLLNNVMLTLTDDIEVVAVSDTYDGWRDRATGAIKEKSGVEAKGYKYHEQMLEDDSIDAIVCATPEHAHHRHIMDTIEAGKDIYCEKPMIHHYQEGLDIIEANQRCQRIIQIGTQRRSVDIYYKAREIVQSGQLGNITAVRGWWHRNSKDDQPQWRYGIPGDASERNIDWRRFLGNAPRVPFDLHRYFQWRCYWDYSNGPAGDLMVHQLDAINIVMGGEMPTSAFGMGSIYRFHELERTTPDTWNATLEYPARNWAPSGYLVNYSCVFSNERAGYGEMFMGTEGTLEMNDQVLRVYPERPEVAAKPPAAVEIKTEVWGDKEHMINFFDCCRTRKPANCTEYHGHYAASAADMACRSHFTGDRITWDHGRNRVL